MKIWTLPERFKLSELNGNFSELVADISDIDDLIATISANGIIGATQYGGTIAGDLNAINKSGFYTAYGTATGAPTTASSWFIIHQNSNVGTASATQRAIAYSTTLIVYERIKQGSTWGSWIMTYGTETGTLSTPTNVSSVTVHSVNKRGGICNYKLRATCTWTAGTSYNLVTLPVEYRPATAFYKNIQIRDTSAVLGSLTITTAGVVSIIPRTATSAVTVSIDEMFFV